MGDVKETSYIHTLEDDFGVITTNEYVYINRFLKLAEERPDDVEVMHHPDDNYGVLMVRVPKKWFVVRPPKVMNFTEEQKAMYAESLRAYRRRDSLEETT